MDNTHPLLSQAGLPTPIEHIVEVVASHNTLVLFDPARLRHREDEDSDWWRSPLALRSEFTARNMVLVEMIERGLWRIHITDGALSLPEQEAVAEKVDGGSLQIDEGRLVVADANSLTAVAEGREDAGEDGELVTLPRGLYSVTIWRLEGGGVPDLVIGLERKARSEAPEATGSWPVLGR